MLENILINDREVSVSINQNDFSEAARKLLLTTIKKLGIRCKWI